MSTIVTPPSDFGMIKYLQQNLCQKIVQNSANDSKWPGTSLLL